MGNTESQEGFRVIDVNPNSPASEAGLMSYLDFIVSINGLKLQPDNTFSSIISKSLECRVFLKVYNIISSETREVVVVPRDNWGGQGYLGATVRWEHWNDFQGLKVLEVHPNSIASSAGLEPNEDFVLGTSEKTFNSIDHLGALIQAQSKLVLYVYNCRTNSVRKVSIENPQKGNLGLSVGEGMLNRLPSDVKELEVKSPNEPALVTVLQAEPQEEQKEEIPPPPCVHIPKTVPVMTSEQQTLKILPPPSIYESHQQKSNFQVLESKYVTS